MRPKAKQAAGVMQKERAVAGPNRTGRPCYLETITERNVTWYRGLGFEVREAGDPLRTRWATELDHDPAPDSRPGRARRPGVQRIRRGSESRNEVSREWRMSAGILLPTAFFLSVLSPDVVPFKARRRSLPSYPAGSMGDSTAFPAGGAEGIVRERSCSEATLDVSVLRVKGIDRWLAT